MNKEEYEKWRSDSYNAESGHMNESDGYDCPICKNKGYISVINDGYEAARECECIKKRKTIEQMKSCGLSADVMSRCRFDNFETHEEWQKKIKGKAVDFVRAQIRSNGQGERSWWYIGGNPGSGKTHISTAIAMQMMKQGKSLQYYCWPTLTSKLNALAAGDSRERQERERILKDLRSTDVLYIDDFFKTGNGTVPSAAAVGLAFDIINARYTDPSKITMFSSERTLKEILKIDEGLGSRIVQRTKAEYTLNISNSPVKNHRLKK